MFDDVRADLADGDGDLGAHGLRNVDIGRPYLLKEMLNLRECRRSGYGVKHPAINCHSPMVADLAVNPYEK